MAPLPPEAATPRAGKTGAKKGSLTVRRLLEESAMTRRLTPSLQLWFRCAPWQKGKNMN